MQSLVVKRLFDWWIFCVAWGCSAVKSVDDSSTLSDDKFSVVLQ